MSRCFPYPPPAYKSYSPNQRQNFVLDSRLVYFRSSMSMPTSADFVFDPLSDDEIETDAHQPNQSPWDFASHSESAADEHARRQTTSIDHKIAKALERISIRIPQDSDFDGNSDFKPDSGVIDYDGEEDDNVPTENSFFAAARRVGDNENSFYELNLSRPLVRACAALGYTKPTPIQAACIPLALTGQDICASATTGSGKTAAFLLPTLERLLYKPKYRPAIRALILTPTRELAVQIYSTIGKLAQFVTGITCSLVIGGLSRKDQAAAMSAVPDIVVCTPGRMRDLMQNERSYDLDKLGILILDEADRLLELGFIYSIHKLVEFTPKTKQTMLFSATMTDEINELIKHYLNKPAKLYTSMAIERPEKLTEEMLRIRIRTTRCHELQGIKESVLLALCSKTFTSQVIIFSGSKEVAHRLKILFGLARFKAMEYHSDLTQAQRLEALELFKRREVDFLIASNLATRGLDISGVQVVINFVCPTTITNYVHQVGRTARAGREGRALTFVTDDERCLMRSLVKRAGFGRVKSRIVAPQSIQKWSEIIGQMEKAVECILKEEKDEAQYMLDMEEARKLAARAMQEKAKAEKGTLKKKKRSRKKKMNAEQAEELKGKRKREKERENNLPRKKRKRLEAKREKLKGKCEDDKGQVKIKRGKGGISLVDMEYRGAKAAKRVVLAGKMGRRFVKRSKNPSRRTN